MFSIEKENQYLDFPYSSLLALNNNRQSLSRGVKAEEPADVAHCRKNVLNAEEESRLDEFLNHLYEFLISRILFRICNHCENIRSHRYLLSCEDVKGHAQLNINSSCHYMPWVILMVTQIKNAEVYCLHHAPESIVIIHAIRFKQWGIRAPCTSTQDEEIAFICNSINIPFGLVISCPVVQRCRE